MNAQTIQEKISPILREYDIRSASLFGSTARGEAKVGSDVDLLIELGRPMGLIAYSRLVRELEEVLGCKVDLLTNNSINTHLRPFIEKDLTAVYEK